MPGPRKKEEPSTSKPDQKTKVKQLEACKEVAGCGITSHAEEVTSRVKIVSIWFTDLVILWILHLNIYYYYIIIITIIIVSKHILQSHIISICAVYF